MKIEFAPLNIPLSRWLQTAAVFQWVFSFLLLAPCCAGIFLMLILGRNWVVVALYVGWLYLDWDTPQSGGRRLEWVGNWTVWRHFRDYFPIHIIKTADLDPKYNYLLGFHPHGVLSTGAFGNFCTNYTGFKELFPGLKPYLHSIPLWFKCPFFRESVMAVGSVSASKKSVTHVLDNEKGGNAAVIVIGGGEEALNAHPGNLSLNILKRKGFIKVALKCGAHLVPVYSFGENELFHQVPNPKGSLLRTVQEKLLKIMGFSIPLFHARGIFQYSFGLMPYRKPINTVVGKPIIIVKNENPTVEEIEQLHKKYLEELQSLFEEHKGKFGIPEHDTLIFT
ncbi:2-acylglycerol O-acyltransferase 1-like isoform X1 [Pleurodeles waltl]|uniref:2-acylglycerol O-acyltransferase 1-like isoform X1 n=1 Tax=Pleurodeles waltl TaxID=8319 RepID=UPI0037096866